MNPQGRGAEGPRGLKGHYPTTTFSFTVEEDRQLHTWTDGPTLRQVLETLVEDPALVEEVLAPDPILGTPGLKRTLGQRGAAAAVAALLPTLRASVEDLPEDFLGDLPGELDALALLELAEAWAQERDFQDLEAAVGPLVAARAEVIHRLAADARARTPLQLVGWAQANWENVVALVPEA